MWIQIRYVPITFVVIMYKHNMYVLVIVWDLLDVVEFAYSKNFVLLTTLVPIVYRLKMKITNDSGFGLHWRK